VAGEDITRPTEPEHTPCTPVPSFNVFLHLSDHPAKCSDRLPFRFEVVRNLVCALVPLVRVAFRDEEKMDKSSERAFQTREFPTLGRGPYGR
jgi:hypothetical protein